MSRNLRRSAKNIDKKDFDFLFEKRSTNNATVYTSPYLYYPEESTLRRLSYKEHYWSSSDRLFKLSLKYYGTTKDWWIISRFNGKPTEADFVVGDRILIPLPLDIIKDYLGYYNGPIT